MSLHVHKLIAVYRITNSSLFVLGSSRNVSSLGSIPLMNAFHAQSFLSGFLNDASSRGEIPLTNASGPLIIFLCAPVVFRCPGCLGHGIAWLRPVSLDFLVLANGPGNLCTLLDHKWSLSDLSVFIRGLTFLHGRTGRVENPMVPIYPTLPICQIPEFICICFSRFRSRFRNRIPIGSLGPLSTSARVSRSKSESFAYVSVSIYNCMFVCRMFRLFWRGVWHASHAPVTSLRPAGAHFLFVP